MTNNYAEVVEDLRKDLSDLTLADHVTMDAFEHLEQVVFADDALSRRMKELIALAIGIIVRCDGCLADHARAAYLTGASREEVIESINVAVQMGGAPSRVWGAEALKAFDQLSNGHGKNGKSTLRRREEYLLENAGSLF